jgi:hypothetical protein
MSPTTFLLISHCCFASVAIAQALRLRYVSRERLKAQNRLEFAVAQHAEKEARLRATIIVRGMALADEICRSVRRSKLLADLVAMVDPAECSNPSCRLH